MPTFDMNEYFNAILTTYDIIQEYSAYPPAHVEWRHNGKEVMQEHRIESNQLVLANPRKYSRGYYQCFVDNSEGEYHPPNIDTILSIFETHWPVKFWE